MYFGVSISPSSMKSPILSIIFFPASAADEKKPAVPFLYADCASAPSAMYFFAISISGDSAGLNPGAHGSILSIAIVPVATSGWPMAKPPTDLVSRTRSVIVGQKSGSFGRSILIS